MSSFACFPKERYFVFPNDLSRLVVFAYISIAFLRDQVIAICEPAYQPGIAMRIGFVDLQFDFVSNCSVLVHFDNAGRSRFGDHGVPILKPLKCVYLDPFARVGFRRVVFPDGLLSRGYLHNLCPTLLIQDVAVRKQVCIVDRPDLDLPFEFSIFRDDGQATFIRIRHEYTSRGSRLVRECNRQQGGREREGENRRDAKVL